MIVSDHIHVENNDLTPKRVNVLLGAFGITHVAVYLLPALMGEPIGYDFLQFYAAARVVAQQPGRLYDQDHFSTVQHQAAQIHEKNAGYYTSLYPPTMALLWHPVGTLSYHAAVKLWFMSQVLCYVVVGFELLQNREIPRRWKPTAIMAALAFLPLIVNLCVQQIAGLWLLVFWAGFELHRRHWKFGAGAVLSLLGLKPQLAMGACLWVLLRRDWRAATGIAVGVLTQLGLVTVFIGPEILVDYVSNLDEFYKILRQHEFSPSSQHSLAAGLAGWWIGSDTITSLLTPPILCHGLLALIATYQLFRLVNRKRQPSADVNDSNYALCWRSEVSAVVLVSLLLPTHLLIYDMCSLLLPIGLLCIRGINRPLDRKLLYVAMTLYASVSTFAFTVYEFVGLSFCPFILLWSLCILTRVETTAAKRPVEPG